MFNSISKLLFFNRKFYRFVFLTVYTCRKFFTFSKIKIQNIYNNLWLIILLKNWYMGQSLHKSPSLHGIIKMCVLVRHKNTRTHTSLTGTDGALMTWTIRCDIFLQSHTPHSTFICASTFSHMRKQMFIIPLHPTFSLPSLPLNHSINTSLWIAMAHPHHTFST